MKKMFSLSTLMLLLVVTILTTACGTAPQAEAAQATAPQVEAEAEEPAISVEVATVETGNIARIFDYSGDLAAQNEVKVIPAAGGRIESLLVAVGDEVKAGDAIATIEQQTYLTQIKQAEAMVKIANLNLAKMKLGSRPEEIAAIQAAVQTARAALNDVATIDDSERTTAAAGLARAQAELRRAQTEYDKIAWAGEVGTTPQALALEQATIDYENSLADYNLDTNPSDSQLAPLQAQLAQAQLQLALTIQPFREVDFETAQANIQQAEAALDAAKIQLDETIIKAPFDGIVAELYIDKGNTVGPQGAVVLVISKEMEVTMDVEESRIGEVVKGQNAALEVTAYPGQIFPAVVTGVSPIADHADGHSGRRRARLLRFYPVAG
jgi:HlyD family secretion protein